MSSPPSPAVVLITGVSQYLGARLAGNLAAELGINRVIGVDIVPPSSQLRPLLGKAEFIRLDMRSPLIGEIVSAANVDTVVHMSVTASPYCDRRHSSAKEQNIIGTMQLLAACQRLSTLRRFILKSSTAVYRATAQSQAVFTEEIEHGSFSAGFAKDATEVEEYVGSFAHRRPDVTLSILRMSEVVGPWMNTPFTRYLSSPVVPTVLGHDPRIQLLHEEDAFAVLRLAIVRGLPGVTNVAANGVMFLSQVIRRAGRVAVPMSPITGRLVGSILKQYGSINVFSDLQRCLNLGRVVDTTRLRSEFGYQTRFSSAHALADFVNRGGGKDVINA